MSKMSPEVVLEIITNLLEEGLITDKQGRDLLQYYDEKKTLPKNFIENYKGGNV